MGEDVAVVGFNDVSIAPELPIPLSTVRSPLRDMGARAVTSLIDRVEGRTVDVVRLRPELIVRESSGRGPRR